jgi:hypothetical protein
MSHQKPVLSINCILTDKTIKTYSMDIDLSWDPLLGKAYIKEWIFHLLEKKYNLLDNVEIFNICQDNYQYCKASLPEWYYELKNDYN